MTIPDDWTPTAENINALPVRRLTPAHLRLIDALAQKAAEDYLREEANSRAAAEAERTNPVQLSSYDQAA